jgi:hypothetical protein
MSAICERCKQDMMIATTCTANAPFEVDGKTFLPVPAEADCGDCGVNAGGLHHQGCDIETCPSCDEQRLFCNCENPRCKECNARMEYVGSDDKTSYYECPECGAEQ